MTSFLTVCISYYVSKGGTLDEALSDLMPRFDSCLFTRLSHEIYPLVFCFLVNFFRVALDSAVLQNQTGLQCCNLCSVFLRKINLLKWKFYLISVIQFLNKYVSHMNLFILEHKIIKKFQILPLMMGSNVQIIHAYRFSKFINFRSKTISIII